MFAKSYNFLFDKILGTNIFFLKTYETKNNNCPNGTKNYYFIIMNKRHKQLAGL